MPLRSRRIPIGCKWLFKIKRHVNGDIARHKARPIAKGVSQKPGFDIQEIFSHVVKYAIV